MPAQLDKLPRKQREFQLREQLILDSAQCILHELGYAQLTMERVADAVEYSKGTIYNHFSSKEDLVCALCCRCVSNLIELFKRAYDYPGTTRELVLPILTENCDLIIGEDVFLRWALPIPFITS